MNRINSYEPFEEETMRSPGKLESKFFLALRWIARIVGSLAVLLIIVFGLAYAIGGDPNATEESDFLTKVSVAGMFTVWVVGVVLGWRWENIGGGILIAGSAIFYIFVPDAMDWPPNPLIAFPITGILFLICWWKSRTAA